ncbi:MAG: RusA family crossover junction endodeoxyribonuclease [Candidatus Sulfotelmatobacter sp.]
MILRYTIPGKPEPKGSLRFVTKYYAKSDNPNLAPWTAVAQWMARQALMDAGQSITNRAVKVSCFFYFKRPKSVKKTEYKITKPDCDKLLRAVLDSLTGIVIEDDAQVVAGSYAKYFLDCLGKQYIEPCTQVILEVL